MVHKLFAQDLLQVQLQVQLQQQVQVVLLIVGNILQHLQLQVSQLFQTQQEHPIHLVH